MQSGHLFLQPAEISKLFNDYNKSSEYPFKNGVVLFSEIEPHIEGLVKDGFIYQDENRYYDINMFFYENESARLLKKIYDKHDECDFGDFNVEEFISEYEKAHHMDLSEDQKESIRSFTKEKVMVITGSPGTGKCLGYGTPVLMYDGTIKEVQDIKTNDVLMGDDSTPRVVLSTATGEEELFEVIPKKGDKYVVNRSHILSLKQSTYAGSGKGKIHDISIDTYFSLAKSFRERLKGYRVPVKFPTKDIPIHPYLLGMWLGNGAIDAPRISTPFTEVVEAIDTILRGTEISIKKVSGDNIEYHISRDMDSKAYGELKGKRKPNFFWNYLQESGLTIAKTVPHLYKANSEEIRLNLLAGIIDSDGSYDKRGNCYDIIFKSEKLLNDVVFIARSLGFSAYPKPCKKSFSCFSKGKYYSGEGTYYRATISGNGLCKIPTKVKKKTAEERKQIKDNLVTGIQIKSIGKGKYYGFQISGNGRFVLGDFTVTHNTTIVKALVELMVRKNISFDLLTPTGISAKKLAKTANYDARTIHRQLGYKGDKWDYHALNKYNTKVVIVDETSMVDMEVFFRLVSALFSHTKIVFVGDNDQLPSVGPGTVLKHLISCACFKVIQLRTIFRQEEQSDIIKAAKRIRDGNTDLSLFKRDKHADIWFLREKNMGTIEETIIRFAQHIKDGNKKKKEPTLFQIITPRNNGPLSVETLNVALQSVLNPPADNKKEVSLNRMIIRKGDRVLIKKNNYYLDVFNGDIGKVVLIVEGNIVIDIDEFDGKTKRVEIPMKLADDMLKLAYAISVHKCAPGYNKIFTERGIIPLSDIKKGDIVLTGKNNKKRVISKVHVGKKEVYRITTKSGAFVDSSFEHRHLVANTSGIYFKEAGNIKNGDYLCALRNPQIGHNEGNSLFYKFENTYYNSDYNYDKVISVEKLPEVDMYDIEVEHDNTYVMNGYVTHNSQGLEYPLIILPIVRAHGQRILQRNLLYTAITRAKKKVVVLGQGSAIEQAINNDRIQRRNTLFDERIRGWMNGDGITLQDLYTNPEEYANQENLKQLLSLETGLTSS